MLYQLSEKIFALEAQGKKITKLNLGEPDWRPSEKVAEAARSALALGKDRYASAQGELALMEKIAEIHGCKPENVVVTLGSKWAIYATIALTLKQGENAVTFSPNWPAYASMYRQAGGTLKTVELKQENNFTLDLEQLEKTIDEKTRLIILNNPSNPTSRAFSDKEEQAVLDIANKNRLRVLFDDAYRDLLFKPRKERPIGEYFTACSFSKTFGMTGWRAGYLIAGKDFVKKMVAFNQITLTNVPQFVQAGALEALEEKDTIARQARKTCEERAELAQRILGRKFNVPMPDAGFYVFPKINSDAIEFAKLLLKKGIAITPGQAFGNYPENIRISLTANLEELKMALEKIVEAKIQK